PSKLHPSHQCVFLEVFRLLFSRLRSRSLTELTRQITPPTKNGHAPPPIESRKSSQICQSLLCLDLVSFPVLSQIKPQAPLLVVPFRQFLYVSALRPYSPRNPKTLISYKVPAESYKQHPPIPGRHRLWLRLGRYLIVFEPPTFVLD